MPTPLPVQLVVMSLPAWMTMALRHVCLPTKSQPTELVIPNSLAVVVRRMKVGLSD